MLNFSLQGKSLARLFFFDFFGGAGSKRFKNGVSGRLVLYRDGAEEFEATLLGLCLRARRFLGFVARQQPTFRHTKNLR